MNKLYNWFRPTIVDNKLLITILLSITLFNIVYGKFIIALGNITVLFVIILLFSLLEHCMQWYNSRKEKLND